MDQHGAAAPPRPAKIPLPGRTSRVASSPRALVSLTQPRPESERQLNAYVETPPKRSPPSPNEALAPILVHSPNPLPSTSSSKRNGGGGGIIGGGGAITVQPNSNKRTLAECRQDSIICSRCGRCRCTECAHPRALPSRWLGDSCLCSAETAIDYLSCMCCAKALFYHCCDEGDMGGCADEPCSCSGTRCGPRWGCLAALALVLPCLACYWPLRGVAAVCAGAYARTATTGCRCAKPRGP